MALTPAAAALCLCLACVGLCSLCVVCVLLVAVVLAVCLHASHATGLVWLVGDHVAPPVKTGSPAACCCSHSCVEVRVSFCQVSRSCTPQWVRCAPVCECLCVAWILIDLDELTWFVC